MAGDELELDEQDEPSPLDVQWVADRLYEFNRAATGIDDGRGLNLFLRDAGGAIQAALTGHTWGDTCEVQNVWVHASLRRRGTGRQLLARAEAIARERGCAQILIATHSFQAPAFYAKLGFEPLFEVADYPRGHSEISLLKRLA